MKDVLKRKSEFLGFDNVRYRKTLAEANEHLKVLGLEEVRVESLEQGASAIALDSEYRIALDAFQSALSAYEVDFSKLFLPLVAIAFTVVVYVQQRLSDPVGSQVFAVVLCSVIYLVFFLDLARSKKNHLRQEIVHRVLERRMQQKEDEKPSAACPGCASRALDQTQPELKQTVLITRKKRHTKRPLSDHRRAWGILHWHKN